VKLDNYSRVRLAEYAINEFVQKAEVRNANFHTLDKLKWFVPGTLILRLKIRVILELRDTPVACMNVKPATIKSKSSFFISSLMAPDNFSPGRWVHTQSRGAYGKGGGSAGTDRSPWPGGGYLDVCNQTEFGL